MPKTVRVDPEELILYLKALQPRVADAIDQLKHSGPLELEVPPHLVPSIGPHGGLRCGRVEQETADDQTLAEIFVFVGDAVLKTAKTGGKKTKTRGKKKD